MCSRDCPKKYTKLHEGSPQSTISGSPSKQHHSRNASPGGCKFADIRSRLANRSNYRAQSLKPGSNAKKHKRGPVLTLNKPSHTVWGGISFDSLSLGKCVGEGTFGKVYLATHTETSENFAVKILKRAGMGQTLDFLKEVKVLQTLNHPNLLPLIDLFMKKGSLIVVTPFMEQGSLGSMLLNKSKEMSWSRRMQIAYDIALGMEFLHCNYVVHRDLKADNVLLADNGAAVVADFGLAEEFGPKRRLEQGGTWSIMAPEVLKCQPFDQSCDIFSFGIVLCELASRMMSEDLPRTDDFGFDIDILCLCHPYQFFMGVEFFIFIFCCATFKTQILDTHSHTTIVWTWKTWSRQE